MSVYSYGKYGDMSGNAKVLVIEDEKDIQSLVRRLLASMELDVIVTENAFEGLQVLKEQAPDIGLIILDLLTPVLTGWEALPIIRKKYPDIKVLISTAFADISDIGNLLSKGEVELLHKPYTISEFRGKVAQLLRQ